MQGSPPAPLTVLLQTASQWVMHALVARLHACGHVRVTEAHLVLFGNLDCGTTYASAIAQRMRVSRQAISKTLRELQTLGLVRLENDPVRANQKLVVMSPEGMRLANDARRELADIEARLADRIGREASEALRSILETGWGDAPTEPSGARA
jgi:DNA-binding MarR family transcriptional regulator